MSTFIGHASVWYETECARNPGWIDFLPETDGSTDTSGRAVSARQLWEGLRRELIADGIPVTISSNRLQTRHRQRLSVIWPRRGFSAPPHERITMHVSARQTRHPSWKILQYGWASEEMRQGEMMYHAVAELLRNIGWSNSFVAFTNHAWYASLLSTRFAFQACSPSRLPAWLQSEYVPRTACYVRALR